MGFEVGDLQRIATVTRAFAEAPGKVTDTIAQQLANVIGDACSVMLVSDDGSLVRASRASIESGDATLAEQMLVPLRARGEVIGQLVLERHRAYDAADRELAALFADHAALAIEHVRVVREAEADRNAHKVVSRELEAFAYSVSHDLKAPLRAVTGFSRLFEESYGDKLDDEGRDLLGEVQKNATKMAALIDALLSFSRLARAELRLSAIDLSALVREALHSLAAAEPDRTVEVEIEGALEAEVDISLARVLVANLVGNAWKFTRNAAHARIAFGEQPSAPVRTFYIRDNGAGFDPRYADKLFAPFQRLHAATEFPGVGIGLAAVQRIAHRHGGRVWAEAAVGAGATFYFTFTQPVVC